MPKRARIYTKREVVEHLAASNALFPYLPEQQQAELILAKSAEMNGQERPSEPPQREPNEWLPDLHKYFRQPKGK